MLITSASVCVNGDTLYVILDTERIDVLTSCTCRHVIFRVALTIFRVIEKLNVAAPSRNRETFNRLIFIDWMNVKWRPWV